MIRIVIFLIFLSSYQVRAQEIKQDDLVGDWLCKHVEIKSEIELTPDERAFTGEMSKGFVDSHFILGVDGIFKFQFADTAPPFVKELKFLNNQRWYFDSSLSKITIGPPSENLMHIEVSRDGDKLLFHIYETPFLLYMVKL